MTRKPSVRHQYIRPGILAIAQGNVNGFEITFNPDDDRFYVIDGLGDTRATFAALRNAVQYARHHYAMEPEA